METRRECWFLGTWVSRRSVDSESENWPRRPGRDWLHGRPPSTPWPSSLAVVRWQVRKRFVWVHRFVLCGCLVLSAVSEGRCGPGPRLPRQPRRSSPRSGPLPDYRGESPSALAHEDAQPCPSKRCGCLLTVTLAVTLAQRAERPAGLPAENRPPGVTPCPPPLASTHFLSASALRPPASEDHARGRAVLLLESELVCAPFAVTVLCVGMPPLVQVCPLCCP